MLIDPFGDRRYEIRVFPSDDVAFAHLVAETFRMLGPDAPQREERLEQILRLKHPHVVVHRRDPLAQIPGQPTGLYVYRDGSPATDRLSPTG